MSTKCLINVSKKNIKISDKIISMYYVYIVKCADDSFYCGQTNNLDKRIKEHNSDSPRSAKYLRGRKPVKLVYSEKYSTLKAALKREWQIKQLSRSAKEALIQGYSPVYIIFGLPGVGKTYVGELFKKYFNFYFYDGDNELTKEMKQAIVDKIPFNDQMRDIFFENLLSKIKKLKNNHHKLVIAQTFIKEKYRKLVLDQIPGSKFVLIKTDNDVRESRLKNRKDYPLDVDYSRKMCLNFDNPKIIHQVVLNNTDGCEDIKKQIPQILLL